MGTKTNLKASQSVVINRLLARPSTPSMTLDCGPYTARATKLFA